MTLPAWLELRLNLSDQIIQGSHSFCKTEFPDFSLISRWNFSHFPWLCLIGVSAISNRQCTNCSHTRTDISVLIIIKTRQLNPMKLMTAKCSSFSAMFATCNVSFLLFRVRYCLRPPSKKKFLEQKNYWKSRYCSGQNFCLKLLFSRKNEGKKI